MIMVVLAIYTFFPPSIVERYQGGTDDPPLLVRFYLLNITNLDSVRQGGKPVVVSFFFFFFFLFSNG